jgi:hypothetical protein
MDGGGKRAVQVPVCSTKMALAMRMVSAASMRRGCSAAISMLLSDVSAIDVVYVLRARRARTPHTTSARPPCRWGAGGRATGRADWRCAGWLDTHRKGAGLAVSTHPFPRFSFFASSARGHRRQAAWTARARRRCFLHRRRRHPHPPPPDAAVADDLPPCPNCAPRNKTGPSGFARGILLSAVCEI